MNLVCVRCPRGCEIRVDGDEISGYFCPRGLDYAKSETTKPMRIVTALVKTTNSVVPVKTDREVPKDKIFLILDELSKLKLDNSHIGDVIIENILDTGANIVVTGQEYQK